MSESRVLADARRRLRLARACSSSSDSESESVCAVRRARACMDSSSVESTEISVNGLNGTMVLGVDAVLVLDAELFGGETSEVFFLVMLRARTLPRVAVLRTEFSRLKEDGEEV